MSFGGNMGTMFNRAKVSFLTSSEQLGYKILTQCPLPPPPHKDATTRQKRLFLYWRT